MPLLDHFHPPLKTLRQWQGFHMIWAASICRMLNQNLLPSGFYAEIEARVGATLEVDVAALDEESDRAAQQEGGVAVWAPPRATQVLLLDELPPDLFEVQVYSELGGPRLVAAIELVSPANKDRPSERHTFAIKCASLLQQGLGLMVVDVVTSRSSNLHDELLTLLGGERSGPSPSLYGAGYRSLYSKEGHRLECWLETLALGSPLPTLPLWISPDTCLPVDLEATYLDACHSLRID